MPTAVKQHRTAERPEFTLTPEPKIVSLAALKRARLEAGKGSLTIKVTLPAKVVPLFNALVAVTEADSPETFAAWAICKGITSEEAMKLFDDLVNDLL